MEFIRKGDAVYIYYGDRNNAKLFLYMGFVIPNNPSDYIDLKVAFPPTSVDALHRIRMMVLQQNPSITMGSENQIVLTLPRIKDKEVPMYSDALLSFLAIATMTKDELSMALKTKSGGRPLHQDIADQKQQNINSELPSAQKAFLAAQITNALGAYATSLSDDEEHILRSQSMSRNASLLRNHLILEKRLLMAHLQYLQS
jgi:hypothetical protein